MAGSGMTQHGSSHGPVGESLSNTVGVSKITEKSKTENQGANSDCKKSKIWDLGSGTNF
jgi:hypothetical protein